MKKRTAVSRKLEGAIDDIVERYPQYGTHLSQSWLKRRAGMPKHAPVNTMGVMFNGTRYELAYGRNFVREADGWYLRLAVHHEIIHIINGHNQRSEYIQVDDDGNPNRTYTIWHYSTDCAVNSIIPEVDEHPEVKEILVHPDNFDLPEGRQAEWYFEKLNEQMPDNPDQPKQSLVVVPSDNDGDESGDGDDEMPEAPDIIKTETNDDDSSGDDGEDDKNNAGGEGAGAFDDESDESPDGDDDADGSGEIADADSDELNDSGEDHGNKSIAHDKESDDDNDSDNAEAGPQNESVDTEQDGEKSVNGAGDGQEESDDEQPDEQTPGTESGDEKLDEASSPDRDSNDETIDRDDVKIEAPGLDDEKGGIVGAHNWEENQDPISKDMKEAQSEKAAKEADEQGDLDSPQNQVGGSIGAGSSTQCSVLKEKATVETKNVQYRFHLQKFHRNAGKRRLKPNIKFKDRRYDVRPRLELKPDKKILFIIDVSGSMNEKALLMAESELKVISQHVDIDVLQHNRTVIRVDEYRGSLPELNAGGGTYFEPPYEYFRKHKMEYSGAMHFTDGRPNDNPEEPAFPILYLYSPSHRDLGYGTSVVIEPSGGEVNAKAR